MLNGKYAARFDGLFKKEKTFSEYRNALDLKNRSRQICNTNFSFVPLSSVVDIRKKKFHSKINRQLHKRLVFVQLLYREKLIASIQLAKIYSFGKIEVNRLTQQTRGAMQHIYFILIQCDIHTYTQSSARASVFCALLCSDKLFMHYLINDLNQPN